MSELIDVPKMYESFRKQWAKSFFIVVALLIGVLIGMVIIRSEILADCKFMGAFRIGDQSFNCTRKI
jgi:hypothetical protein